MAGAVAAKTALWAKGGRRASNPHSVVLEKVAMSRTELGKSRTLAAWE